MYILDLNFGDEVKIDGGVIPYNTMVVYGVIKSYFLDGTVILDICQEGVVIDKAAVHAAFLEKKINKSAQFCAKTQK